MKVNFTLLFILIISLILFLWPLKPYNCEIIILKFNRNVLFVQKVGGKAKSSCISVMFFFPKIFSYDFGQLSKFSRALIYAALASGCPRRVGVKTGLTTSRA